MQNAAFRVKTHPNSLILYTQGTIAITVGIILVYTIKLRFLMHGSDMG